MQAVLLWREDSIMATTRIMPLHTGKGRTESQAISDIIDYVSKVCSHKQRYAIIREWN